MYYLLHASRDFVKFLEKFFFCHSFVCVWDSRSFVNHSLWCLENKTVWSTNVWAGTLPLTWVQWGLVENIRDLYSKVGVLCYTIYSELHFYSVGVLFVLLSLRVAWQYKPYIYRYGIMQYKPDSNRLEVETWADGFTLCTKRSSLPTVCVKRSQIG